MITRFKPIHTATYNCLEDVLECIATGFKREHILIYADAWDFNYYLKSAESKKIIGNRIEAGEYNAWNSLAKYHGIKAKCHFTSQKDKQIKVLKEELRKENPIVLWLDGYYVPWTNVFEKLHMKHFVIAVGMDEEKKKIYVIDPYWNKKVNQLAYEHFDLSKAKCISFSVLEQPEILWKKVISSRVDTILGREYTAFDAMRAFAKDTQSLLKIEKEIEGFEELRYNCPLFMQLAEVFYRRLNYSKMLIFLGENNLISELLNLGMEMKQIGESWKELRELLVKIMEGKEAKDQIKIFAEGIIQLADYEEEIARKLRTISQ